MTAAFAELMQQPTMANADGVGALDRAALLVAKHARPDLDVDAQLERLDDLASRVGEPTLDGLTRLLFDDLAFTGNTASYYDPKNSLLDQVLDRRWGIPITLSIVMVEVGRRCGVPLRCIGMPGHFLVRDQVDQELFVDPFASGRRMDLFDCEQIYRRILGPDAPFSPDVMQVSAPVATIARLLGNLKGIYSQHQRTQDLAWVLRLRCTLPGISPNERLELAGVLTTLGQYAEAADQCDNAAEASPQHREQLRARSERLRARLN